MILTVGRDRCNGKPHQYTQQAKPDYWVCSVIVSGQRVISNGRQEYIRKAPGVSLVKANVSYIHRTMPPSHQIDSIWVIFRPWAAVKPYLSLPEPIDKLGWLSLENHPYCDAIIEAYIQTHYWSKQLTPMASKLAANAFERAWLMVAESQASAVKRHDPRIQQAIDYIQAHYNEPLCVEQLAEQVYLSSSRFAHLFQLIVNQSPMQYVESIRMEEAKALLLGTNFTVKSIAGHIGFANPFHFATRFSKYTGTSPTAFRSE